MKSTKQVVVKVTRRHISSGIVDANSCPIALALRGIAKDEGYVCEKYVEMNHRFLALPKSARKFIDAFDTNGENAVKPFNFRMRLPVKSLINRKNK